MALSEQRKEYLYEYQKNKLKRIPLDVTKEKYDEIKDSAEANNEKVNGYIKAAIDRKLSTVEIPLNQGINTNIKIQEELEEMLLKNGDGLTGYSRVSCSDGSARLELNFKSKSDILSEVVEAFMALLDKYGVLK